MVMTLSFNQILAAVLVLVVIVLLITVLVLASKVKQTTQKVGTLVDDSDRVVKNVNDAVTKTSEKVLDNVSNIGTMISTASAAIIIVSVDRRIRKLIKKTRRK